MSGFKSYKRDQVAFMKDITNMSTLLTGGNGKTGIRLAKLLHDESRPFLVASRSGNAPAPYAGVKFDWYDEATYALPFQAAKINAVYLVAPPGSEEAIRVVMNRFVDYCVDKGVQRFVLLSSTQLEKGGPGFGKVHEYLEQCGVEYCVLRPSWFMQNFTELQHSVTIRDEDSIYSATDDGKIPFIAAEDIAEAAFRALTSSQSPNTDWKILGPDLYSYDEVAQILTTILGRPIRHIKLSEVEMKNRFAAMGMPEDYAGMLSMLDRAIANGAEEGNFTAPNSPNKVIGKIHLEQFLKEHSGLLKKA